jgi:hypothetical protein
MSDSVTVSVPSNPSLDLFGIWPYAEQQCVIGAEGLYFLALDALQGQSVTPQDLNEIGLGGVTAWSQTQTNVNGSLIFDIRVEFGGASPFSPNRAAVWIRHEQATTSNTTFDNWYVNTSYETGVAQLANVSWQNTSSQGQENTILNHNWHNGGVYYSDKIENGLLMYQNIWSDSVGLVGRTADVPILPQLY